MEEIFQQIDRIFEKTENSRREIFDDFEIFKTNLDAIVYGTKETSLTPQQKRKLKRLSVIVDTEELEFNGSQISEIAIKNEITDTSTISSTRPSRAAKLKVSSLKEPSLTQKLRRPSQADESCLRNITQILEEPTNETTAKSSAEKSIPKIDVTTKRSLEDDKENAEKDDSVESPKKVDDSLLIVPSGDLPVLEISDNENDRLMPPPADIPKKRTTRKANQSDTSSGTSTRSSRLRIKQEKLSISESSQKDKNSETTTEAVENIEETVNEIKKEELSEAANTSKRGKSKRGKKAFKCLPIKEEAENVKASEKGSSNEDRVTRSKGNTRPTSTESVYEDAISNAAPLVSGKPKPASEEKNKDTDRVSKEMPGDATFVSAKDIPINEHNVTFVASGCPQQTFVMEKGPDQENNAVDGNITHVVLSNMPASSTADATFNINNHTFKAQTTEQQQQSNEVLRSSIMTEEDSTDEIMAPPAPIQRAIMTKSKQKKELFNPCIQSPVKKKVEAFEKHAASALASPRQTRNKVEAKENRDPEHITPLLRREIAKHNTPTQTYITPTIGMLNTKFPVNRSAKLTPSQKSAKAPTSVPKAQSLSRENSAEDVKRATYNSKLQQMADEKKKKREQKQQQAALSREAREKERIEKLEKAMQEREEKARQKQQKLHEERCEAQKKLDKKQLEQDLAEAARKEREMLDNLKIQRAKEELQQKLLENQRMLQEKKMAIKAKEALKYDFDQLNSGDSTDEEDKPSKKRPPPPIWSKTSIRKMLIERQTQMPAIIVDSFFSVQPMTPDLKEIFPAIDPRYLKRNSSMYWNTPPKYDSKHNENNIIIK